MENETRFIKITDEDHHAEVTLPDTHETATKQNPDSIPYPSPAAPFTLRTIVLVGVFLLALLLLFLTFLFNDFKRLEPATPTDIKTENAPLASRQTVVADVAYLKETKGDNKYDLTLTDRLGKEKYTLQSFKLFQTAADLNVSTAKQTLVYAETTDDRSGNYETALWVKYPNRAAVKIFTEQTKGRVASHPQIAPDGKTIIYALTQAEEGGKITADLWQINLNGENNHSLLQATEKSIKNGDGFTFLAPLAWTQDSQIILTAVSHADAKNLGGIYILDPTTQKLQSTAAPTQVFSATNLSSDGKKLVYLTDPAAKSTDNSSGENLSILNLASNQSETVSLESKLHITSVVWSNDNKRIIYAASDPTAARPTYEIFSLDPTTQKSVSLLKGKADHFLQVEKVLNTAQLIFTDQDQTVGTTSLNTLNLLDPQSTAKKIDEAPSLFFFTN